MRTYPDMVATTKSGTATPPRKSNDALVTWLGWMDTYWLVMMMMVGGWWW
jgi:hypothetical protein